MKTILFVGLGSMLGGILRYGIGLLPLPTLLQGFPLWTLVINLLGCFLIGLLTALAETTSLDAAIARGLTVGLCGGFTTFSTFSKECLMLKESGAYSLMALYILLSVALGIVAVYAGRGLIK